MDNYRTIARQYANEFGIPVDLFMRQIQSESAWNPAAVSPAGAIGFGQLMPATAQELGVDIMNPQENLYGAAKYLRQMHDRFGDWRLALAAYNAGPGRVEQYGGIPPFKETQNYVSSILDERDVRGGPRMSTSNSPQSIADDTMSALGMRGREMPQQQPMGLLEHLGIQKMGSGGPQGDVPFYQRDRFKDAAGALALALNDMQLRPGQGVAQNVAAGRQRRAGNRTIEWLAQQPGGAEFVQMLEAGADPAQVLMAYRQAQQPAETFRQVTGAQIGLQGEDAAKMFNVGPDGKVTAIGGSGPTFNVGGDALTPFEKGSQEFQVKMWGNLAANAPTAQATLGQVELLDTLLKESGSGFSQGLSKFVYDTTGFDAQGSAASAASALINQLVPAQLPQGSGTMSDADLALYKGSLPQLQRSPEGNQIILDGMRALAQYNLATSRIAAQVLNGQMTPQEGDAAVVALGNPLADVNARIRQQGQGGTTGTGGAPVAGDVVDGYRFKGGNPADQNNWEPI